MIGLQDGRRVNIRPAEQMWLPFEIKGGLFTTKADTASPVEGEQLMEKVVDRNNLLTALRNVKRNGGSPGIDGMTVEELPEYLKKEMVEDPSAIGERDICTASSQTGGNTQTRRWDTTAGYPHRAGSFYPAGNIASIAARLGWDLF